MLKRVTIAVCGLPHSYRNRSQLVRPSTRPPVQHYAGLTSVETERTTYTGESWMTGMGRILPDGNENRMAAVRTANLHDGAELFSFSASGLD